MPNESHCLRPSLAGVWTCAASPTSFLTESQLGGMFTTSEHLAILGGLPTRMPACAGLPTKFIVPVKAVGDARGNFSHSPDLQEQKAFEYTSRP